MMNFTSKETCQTVDTTEYKISTCFNGEFYSSQLLQPPSLGWHLFGFGATEEDSVNDLMGKLKLAVAA